MIVYRSINKIKPKDKNMTEKTFNIEAALFAINNTPKKVIRSNSNGDFSNHIIEIFKLAKSELSLNQVKEAYNAATGENKKSKEFADRCWLLDKRGILEKLGGGVYKLKSDATEAEAE